MQNHILTQENGKLKKIAQVPIVRYRRDDSRFRTNTVDVGIAEKLPDSSEWLLICELPSITDIDDGYAILMLCRGPNVSEYCTYSYERYMAWFRWKRKKYSGRYEHRMIASAYFLGLVSRTHCKVALTVPLPGKIDMMH